MTLKRTIEVECPNCGAKQPATIWSSVNVTLDPELRQRLLERDLTSFHCGDCGHSAELAYDMLYHDMTRRILVWLVAGGAMPDDDASMAFGKLGAFGGDPYRLRVVDSMNGLIEKIRIGDADLDDRFLEVLKTIVWRNMGEEGRRHGGELLFSAVDLTPDGESVVRFALVADDSVSSVTATEELQVRVRERCAEFLPTVEDERDRWIRVNQEYVRSVLEPFGGPDGGTLAMPDRDDA
jgi:hypothetical protein